MRDFNPRLPIGFDDEALFAQSVHRRTFGAGGQLRDSATAKIRRTSKGIYVHAVGGGNSGAIFLGRLKSVQCDYLTCRAWNGTADGAVDIYVAKDFKHRCQLTAITVMDVAHTYTYASNLDSNSIDNTTRTDSYSSTSETQRIVPPWVQNDLIYAVRVPAIKCYTISIADGNFNMATWLMAFESRQWARI